MSSLKVINLQNPSASNVALALTTGGNLIIGTNASSPASAGNATVVINGIGTNGGGIQLMNTAGGGALASGLSGGGIAFSSFTGSLGAETYVERMRIHTNGTVGIGTNLPVGQLHVQQSSGSLIGYFNSSAASQNVRLRINSTDTASSVAFTWSYSDASLNKQASTYLTGGGALAWMMGQTAGSEPTSGTLGMWMDPTGTVGVGTNSPGAKLTVRGDTGDNATFDIKNNNTNSWKFWNDNGANNLNIQYNGATKMMMTANNTGNLYVGAASSVWNETLSMQLGGGNSPGLGVYSSSSTYGTGTYANSGNGLIMLQTETTAGTGWRFLTGRAQGGNNVLYIFGNGTIQNSTGSFAIISDQRLKENITDTGPKLDDLMKVRVVNYNLKSDDSKTKMLGMIAQELEQVFPGLVDTDPADGIKGVKLTVFIPMLIKAMQELKADFDSLKSELVAISGAKNG